MGSYMVGKVLGEAVTRIRSLHKAGPSVAWWFS
jgi:hypothetical protein